MMRCDVATKPTRPRSTRVAEQARLRRRARRRAFALGAAVAAITAGALVAAMGAAGTARTARIAIVTSNDTTTAGERATLYEQGLVRAERDFDLDVERHVVRPRPSSATSRQVTRIS